MYITTSIRISTIITISLEFNVDELNACTKNDDAIGNASLIRKNENANSLIKLCYEFTQK